MAGRPKNFSPNQLKALRAAFRDWHAEQESTQEVWSQGRAGAAIGVSQQVAGRLLKSEDAGLQYSTALQIARLVGFETLDEFFRSRAVHATDAGIAGPEDTNWRWRDLGFTLARRAGGSELAIANVKARYASDSTSYTRKPIWWITKVAAEDDDLKNRPPEPTPLPVHVADPTKTKRQKAG